MNLTTAFALGIGSGLLISFFRELYVKYKTAKHDIEFYFRGYAEASNHAIKQLDDNIKKAQMARELEAHIYELVEKGKNL